MIIDPRRPEKPGVGTDYRRSGFPQRKTVLQNTTL
jgi:hypothetical protein